MAFIAIIAVLLLVLWVMGNNPRKTVAQTIVLAEDVKDKGVEIAKATPAKVAVAKDHTVKAVGTGVVVGQAVTAVAVDRGSKVAGVVAVHAVEAVKETNHYFKGFTSDVALLRRQIKADRKRDARARRAMETHGLAQVIDV